MVLVGKRMAAVEARQKADKEKKKEDWEGKNTGGRQTDSNGRVFVLLPRRKRMFSGYLITADTKNGGGRGE